MNEENPNWRIRVGINGTAGDVPKDNTIRFQTKKSSVTRRSHTSVEEKVMRLHRQHFFVYFELHFADGALYKIRPL